MRSSLLLFLPLLVKADNGTTSDEGEKHFPFFVIQHDRVAAPLGICVWILLACVARIVLQLNRRLAGLLPESSLLILVGIAAGYVLHGAGVPHVLFAMESHTFFIYLLPPIMLEAGYFMPNRALFENFWPIASFAVFGTIFNAAAIAGSLMWISSNWPFSVPISTLELLLFSSLISAVDPVAVIAFFEEIHVNSFLFASVIREALFNDSVVVMLCQMWSKFVFNSIEPSIPMLLIGSSSLLFIAGGGVLLGLAMAAAVAFLTRISPRAESVNSVLVFAMSYICFLVAELFGISSIIASAVYGMAAKRYIRENVPMVTDISIGYLIRSSSHLSNAVTYLLLGLSVFSIPQHIDLPFIGYTLLFCTAYRIIGVVVQCWFANFRNGRTYTAADQLILALGGLRGAIAYGLVLDLSDSSEAKNMFATTTLAVIHATVFLQGSVLPTLVRVLGVELDNHDVPTVIRTVQSTSDHHMLSGVESIIGQPGYPSFYQRLESWNHRFIRPLFVRTSRGSAEGEKLKRAFVKRMFADVREDMEMKPKTDIQKFVENCSSAEFGVLLEAIERRAGNKEVRICCTE